MMSSSCDYHYHILEYSLWCKSLKDILGRNPGTQGADNGWKINSGAKLVSTCQSYQDNETERCIEENTFAQSDIVKNILLGSKPHSKEVLKGKQLDNNRSISVLNNLSPIFALTAHGMTFAWNSAERISPKIRS